MSKYLLAVLLLLQSTRGFFPGRRVIRPVRTFVRNRFRAKPRESPKPNPLPKVVPEETINKDPKEPLEVIEPPKQRQNNPFGIFGEFFDNFKEKYAKPEPTPPPAPPAPAKEAPKPAPAPAFFAKEQTPAPAKPARKPAAKPAPAKEPEISDEDLQASIQLAQSAIDGTIADVKSSMLGDEEKGTWKRAEKKASEIKKRPMPDPKVVQKMARNAIKAYEDSQKASKEPDKPQAPDDDPWSSKTVKELKDECGKRQLVKTGIKSDLMERLAQYESYPSLTIAQLKVELRKRGLPVSGKKQDLVDRLRQPKQPVVPQQKGASSKKAPKGMTNGMASSKKVGGMATAAAGIASKGTTAGMASKVATAGMASKGTAAGMASKVTTAGMASKVTPAGMASKGAAAGMASKVTTAGMASKGMAPGMASKGMAASKVTAAGMATKVTAPGMASKGTPAGRASKVTAPGMTSKGMAVAAKKTNGMGMAAASKQSVGKAKSPAPRPVAAAPAPAPKKNAPKGYDAMTVVQLRKELQARKLSSVGRKDELIAKLEADDAKAPDAPATKEPAAAVENLQDVAKAARKAAEAFNVGVDDDVDDDGDMFVSNSFFSDPVLPQKRRKSEADVAKAAREAAERFNSGIGDDYQDDNASNGFFSKVLPKKRRRNGEVDMAKAAREAAEAFNSGIGDEQDDDDNMFVSNSFFSDPAAKPKKRNGKNGVGPGFGLPVPRGGENVPAKNGAAAKKQDADEDFWNFLKDFPDKVPSRGSSKAQDDVDHFWDAPSKNGAAAHNGEGDFGYFSGPIVSQGNQQVPNYDTPVSNGYRNGATPSNGGVFGYVGDSSDDDFGFALDQTDDGMFETAVAPRTSRDWSKLSVPQLRMELGARGLPTHGAKIELVAALEADDDQGSSELDMTDMEAVGRAARESVRLSEEEPSDEALWEIENEVDVDDTSSVEIPADILLMARRKLYEEMAVSELKDKLKKRGLRVTGKKADLISRLQEATT